MALDAQCSSAQREDDPWRPGCATHRNIAAMAENPDDLYVSRRSAPRDAMRRDAVLGAYMRNRSSAPQATAGATSASGAAGSEQ